MERIERLTIIGVGLIGGSLARALKAAGVVGEIVGAGRRSGPLERALELGVIDRWDTDLPRAVAGADMVLVAVPLGAVFKVIAAVADHLPEDCILTDAGSAKGCVVEDVRRVFGRLPSRFVPGHPIAGTEKSGVEASFAELYRNRRVILTPLAETEAEAHEKVRWMWQAAGAEVVDMGVEHHDQVLAATSHLPHVLAYCLVDSLARLDDRAEIFRYAAGGFRDFTRIASSHPQMWHDICLANRRPLLAMIERFQVDLNRISAALEQGNGETVLEIFLRAKRARDNLYHLE
ncbi:MAG: prephenate dehydrogenase/arogenate dehydrogenase family protein [Candidatus Competibacteraceae bacterium]|nr:prephenate dehydrogenase/arogenate dehydrogenase family protein [Candidatus Competibacteraceae bacterium]